MKSNTTQAPHWIYGAACATAVSLDILIYGALFYFRYYFPAEDQSMTEVTNVLLFAFGAQAFWGIRRSIVRNQASPYKVPWYSIVAYGLLGGIGNLFYNAEVEQRKRDDSRRTVSHNVWTRDLNGWVFASVVLLFFLVLYVLYAYITATKV